MAHYLVNPLMLPLEVCDALYPGKCDGVQIMFARLRGCKGKTYFPDDGGTPEILIKYNCPMDKAIQLVAHELAHVVAGADAEHGPEWETAFEAICGECGKRAAEILAPYRGEGEKQEA